MQNAEGLVRNDDTAIVSHDRHRTVLNKYSCTDTIICSPDLNVGYVQAPKQTQGIFHVEQGADPPIYHFFAEVWLGRPKSSS